MSLAAVFDQSWSILRDVAAYILVGFVIASLMHVWLSRGRLAAMLQSAGPRSVFFAALVGAPMPLCSCAVLPAAITMRRRGASKGATLSFLVSTPETSLTSILLTYALIGPMMAVVRPIAACICALATGLMEDFVDRRWPGLVPGTSNAFPAAATDCCKSDHDHSEDHQHPTFTDGFRHAFVDIFDDVVGWMLFSVVVAAAISVFIPNLMDSPLLGSPWWSMLILLVIGIPTYVCAEASTPIAAALILKGISPGAALVFLLSGPATNFATVAVIAKQLGRRSVIIYLVTIALVALALGGILNMLSQQYAIIPRVRPSAEQAWMPESVNTAAALIFLMMAALSFRRLRYGTRLIGWLNQVLGTHISPRQGGFATGFFAIAVYLVSGFASIGPDQIGMLRRFGRITDSSVPPGLYYIGPWPVGRLDGFRIHERRRITLGQIPAAIGAPPSLDEKTGWVWLGDQNVVSLVYVVQWSIRQDAVRQFAYGVRDPESVVRFAALSAIREVLSTSTIDDIYTTARKDAERDTLRIAQEHCNRAGSGIEIAAFELQSVHAPTEVHDAFRDVASALEDKATRINQAEGERARLIPIARGNAAMKLSDARGEAATKLAIAHGDASSFLSLIAAAAPIEAVTRWRIYFEMLDRVLPGIRKYVRVGRTSGRALELWFRGDKMEPLPSPQPPAQVNP